MHHFESLFKVSVRRVIQKRFKAGLLREELTGVKYREYSLCPFQPNSS